MGFKELSLLQHDDFGQVRGYLKAILVQWLQPQRRKLVLESALCGCSEPGDTGGAVLPDLCAF